MTKKKGLLALLCVLAIVVSGAFGTLAYLTDDDSAVNTFTVGKVKMKLDEAPVDANGKETSGARVKENDYHLLPGQTYDKDPMVTMLDGSEDAYVRMLVTVSDIDKMEAAFPKTVEAFENFYATYNDQEIFLLQMLCMDEDNKSTWNNTYWPFYGYTESTDGATDVTSATYEFRHNEVVTKTTGDNELPALFTEISVPGLINNDQLAKLQNATIKVEAHAIQAKGFENETDPVAAAWAAFATQQTANPEPTTAAGN